MKCPWAKPQPARELSFGICYRLVSAHAKQARPAGRSAPVDLALCPGATPQPATEGGPRKVAVVLLAVLHPETRYGAIPPKLIRPQSISRRAASARGGKSGCRRRHSSIASSSSAGNRNSVSQPTPAHVRQGWPPSSPIARQLSHSFQSAVLSIVPHTPRLFPLQRWVAFISSMDRVASPQVVQTAHGGNRF
jgi:hypothetical protein